MNDIHELEEYLDLRPRDHQTRWRLAKKYYKLSQYQAAQTHLEVLKEQWVPKINVCRYLAATSYRLGDFEKAIAVLEDAIKEWPEELPVREQLARVLEAAGRRDAAAAMWREILRLQPQYDSAQDALERLPKNDEAVLLEDKDFGIEKNTSLKCPSCGTWNTDEFERCWKCQSLLHGSVQPAEEKAQTAVARIVVQTERKRRTSALRGTALVVIWGAGIYLTVRCHMLAADIDDASSMMIPARLFDASLLATRMVIGLGLTVSFPFSIWLALMGAKCSVPADSGLFAYGFALAGLAYAALWAPLQLIGWLYGGVLVLSLLMMVLLLKVDYSRALAAWSIHLALVTLTAVGAYAGAEGTVGIKDFPVLVRFAIAEAPVVSKQHLSHVQLPHEASLSWRSTGSKWLDKKVNYVAAELTSSKLAPPLSVELRQQEKTLFYGRMNATPFSFHQRLGLELPIKLILRANEPNEVDVVIYSLLKPGS